MKTVQEYIKVLEGIENQPMNEGTGLYPTVGTVIKELSQFDPNTPIEMQIKFMDYQSYISEISIHRGLVIISS